MTVEQVVPSAASIELAAMLTELKHAGSGLEPFADEVIGFCTDFSRALFNDVEAKGYPELQALAFWMRKAELVRMREEFAALAPPETLRVPRGLVFHIPPANVDTIFIYSWLVAVLTGNTNIIRLSPRASVQTDVMCRVFSATLQTAAPALRHNTVMLRYGHEQEVTAQISAAADVRIVWGGDATVRTIRAIPLPPHATELTFPDRYSLAVIHTARYLAADAARRERLAEDFFNDTLWFDQMACSSPRLVVWQGEAADTAAASAWFLALLKTCIDRKGYQVQPQTRLHRFTFACAAALDGRASFYQDRQEIAILETEDLRQVSRDHCGGGLLFQHRITALEELIPFVGRRDQTMTYFGFDPAELKAFARKLNGRGLDRIVPAGQALRFHRFWDGYDLLQELTRHVYIGS
jgi:hypothetical protein